MRLREGLRVVRRSASEVQVGTDPRWAVRVTDLTPDEVGALLAADDGHRRVLPTATARLRAVAGQLAAAQLATARDERRSTGTAAPDATAWDLHDGDGPARVAARRARRVGVLGLGPTGTTTAVSLAAAGVGTVLVDDARPVRSVDVGACGFRWADVGREREAVVARLLRDTAPDVAIDAAGDPDLLVVVEHGATDPVRAAMLLAADVPHLSVVVREADVVVGPLVVGGEGPCLLCLDLHRTEVDPAWPLVADGLARPAWDGQEVAVLAGVAGGMAAAAALAYLDRDVRLAASYEIGLADAVPRRRDWAVHPSCGCTAPSV
ncbi:ThiF family adenylyltransferase [Cellulomonas edaphi]|uniref:Thiamine biosynthesis protein ThiF n=1 Tax=Cellulomonas edaphi TaxID=3053468 RepID=A0ABT7S8D9_9CELL|nr:ThiF family adenylyltransferase [Cellulomons edaphi]MDM7831881.1 thiamine biosynthesis protein ThiF [Cellulomons edaphi]